jgi:DNA processing protein
MMGATPTPPSLFDQAAPPEGHGEPPANFALALLALGSVKGLGMKALRALVAVHGEGLGHALHSTPEEVAAVFDAAKVAGAAKLAAAVAKDPAGLLKRGEARLRDLGERGVRILPPSAVPTRLREIPDRPPLWLFVQGNPGLLERRPGVAVVGTRTPTEQGVRAASVVAKILAAHPVVLISGLAQGIDEEAHRTSLAHGLPNVAFLGHGIDLVFPEQTADVRQAILDAGGAVVTEYLPWERYQKRFFIERNRLQAGLADLVVPVEANPSGGTAHTVRFTREFGRPLVGVRWRGANGMIAELEKAGVPLVDIFTQTGCRQFDGMVRRLVESHGREASPLRLLEQQALKEIRSRDVRPGDLRKLIGTLEAAAKELGDGGQQGSDPGPQCPPGK